MCEHDAAPGSIRISVSRDARVGLPNYSSESAMVTIGTRIVEITSKAREQLQGKLDDENLDGMIGDIVAKADEVLAAKVLAIKVAHHIQPTLGEMPPKPRPATSKPAQPKPATPAPKEKPATEGQATLQQRSEVRKIAASDTRKAALIRALLRQLSHGDDGLDKCTSDDIVWILQKVEANTRVGFKSGTKMVEDEETKAMPPPGVEIHVKGGGYNRDELMKLKPSQLRQFIPEAALLSLKLSHEQAVTAIILMKNEGMGSKDAQEAVLDAEADEPEPAWSGPETEVGGSDERAKALAWDRATEDQRLELYRQARPGISERTVKNQAGKKWRDLSGASRSFLEKLNDWTAMEQEPCDHVWLLSSPGAPKASCAKCDARGERKLAQTEANLAARNDQVSAWLSQYRAGGGEVHGAVEELAEKFDLTTDEAQDAVKEWLQDYYVGSQAEKPTKSGAPSARVVEVPAVIKNGIKAYMREGDGYPVLPPDAERWTVRSLEVHAKDRLAMLARGFGVEAKGKRAIIKAILAAQGAA